MLGNGVGIVERDAANSYIIFMPYKDPTSEKARESAAKASRKYWDRKAKEAAERRREKIENRPRWPVEDLAWAAGFFEGEGTFHIGLVKRPDGSTYVRGSASLVNTDYNAVKFFADRWPPSVIYERKKQAEHHRRAWIWAVRDWKLHAFCLDMLPYLRTVRREQCELILRWQEEKRQGSREIGYADRMAQFARESKILHQESPLGAGSNGGSVPVL